MLVRPAGRKTAVGVGLGVVFPVAGEGDRLVEGGIKGVEAALRDREGGCEGSY